MSNAPPAGLTAAAFRHDAESMKPIRLFLTATLLAPMVLTAQEGSIEMQLSTETGKPKTVITPPATKPKSEQEKRLEFEGFMVGLLSSNKLMKVFDLTAPVEPEKEKERVVVDRTDGRTIGFRLISIRF
jgi:hypothetical protein